VSDAVIEPTPIRKASDRAEIGSSGLRITGGRVRDEFHPRLRDNYATKTYREMRDNDPIVGAILFSIDMTLREIEWHAEPSDPQLEAAQLEAQFLTECLGDMSHTWPQFISAALSFLPFGWAFFETVYKIRGGPSEDATTNSRYSDRRIGWRKQALRVQESLYKWDFDENGGIQAFVQTTDSGTVTIPIDKGLLFRTTTARSNPEGRSVLRNAYRPWFFKKRIEEIEAIGIERDLAGLPVALVPPGYLDDNAPQAAKAVLEDVKTILRDIRADAQTSVVFPKELDEGGHEMWELKLLTSGGRRNFDTDAIVARYDQRIAMTLMADFLLLGHEAVGSKALGVSKVELFTTALTAFLDEIEYVMNDYAIPRLMKLNNVPEALWPKLRHGEVRRVDLGELGAYIKDIASSGVILDAPIEERLREVGGLPPADPEAQQV
jgi:hypothetical protein